MDTLEQIDKEYLLHTYARDYTQFTHGNGARIYTKDNDEFIDFSAGIGVNSLGHNNKALVECITSQASRILHLSNLFVIPPQALLAKKMVELMGAKMRVFFSNSGLEANECAIKIARKYGESTNRFNIITLQGSFHGRSIATLRACGQEKMHKHFAPFPDGFSHAKDIDRAIELSIEHKSVAIMIELIQGEGGIYALDKAKVKALRKHCDDNDILLIVDEIQSGIYRSGEFVACKNYEITPDIITFAKGLAGGIPIGATMTNKIDIFEAGEHGSTFGGNFLAMSAGLCTLEVLESYKNSGELDKHIALFEANLVKLKEEFGDIIMQIAGIGLMRGLKMKDEKTMLEAIQSAKAHKLLVLKSGNATLRLLPPILISSDEIEEGFKRLRQAFIDIK